MYILRRIRSIMQLSWTCIMLQSESYISYQICFSNIRKNGIDEADDGDFMDQIQW